jgi:hypothetical protein
MNLAEAEALVELVKSGCPRQKWGANPAEAWHMWLAGVSASDALAAVEALGLELDFISPRDINRKVQEMRSRNLAASVRPTPQVDPDLPQEYQREVARLDQMIASGAVRTRLPELESAARRATPATDEIIAAKAALTGHDARFLRRRELANTIKCERPGCGAPVGVSCHVDGVTLTRSEAHHERMAAVGLVAAHTPPSDAQIAAVLERDGGAAQTT